MKIKYIFFGIFVAALHFALMYPLALYFGLGMSPSGAWFLENIYAQPGTAIESLLFKNGLIESKNIFVVLNIVFYFVLGTSVAFLFAGIKNKKNSRSN